MILSIPCSQNSVFETKHCCSNIKRQENCWTSIYSQYSVIKSTRYSAGYSSHRLSAWNEHIHFSLFERTVCMSLLYFANIEIFIQHCFGCTLYNTPLNSGCLIVLSFLKSAMEYVVLHFAFYFKRIRSFKKLLVESLQFICMFFHS